MPGLTGLHVDRELSNVSIKYRNGNYIADKLAPIIKVRKFSDLIPVYDRSNFRIPKALRQTRSRSSEIDWGANMDRYICEQYALSVAIDDAERQNADEPFNLDVDSTELVTDCLMLNREYQVASYVLNSSNADWTKYGTDYSATHFVNLAAAWDDRAGADPRGDIYFGKFVIWRDARINPNNLFLPVEACYKLAQTAQIDELRKYTDPNLVSDSNIPTKLWGLNVSEAQTTFNAAAEGATAASFQEVWGNNAIMTYTNPTTMTLRSLTAVATFQAEQFQTVRWREEWRHCDLIEVRSAWGIKMISPACIFVYANAYTATV